VRWLRGVSAAGLVLATIGVASIPASGEGDADADFQSLAARRGRRNGSDLAGCVSIISSPSRSGFAELHACAGAAGSLGLNPPIHLAPE